LALRSESAVPFLDAFFPTLLERGFQYFLPHVRLESIGAAESHSPVVRYEKSSDGGVHLDWLGMRYALESRHKLSENERRLLKSVSRVLSARYRFLFNRDLASQAMELFRGVPEDRYVSAYLDPVPYTDIESRLETPDRVADAIEVLRISALTTYENRRIVTGVLVFGAQPDPCHLAPPRPAGALPYSTALTSIRSFHRLCDGLQTLALVNEEGLLVELVDVQQWTEAYAGFDLPVPQPTRYEAHCRATLCGGHTCLVLTPNGEIKVFAEGAQIFNFIDGRWRLTDAVDKYRQWAEAIGNEKLAEKLYRVALNLAEERRGGLFVVLDDAASAGRFLAPGDLLDREVPADSSAGPGSKDQLHYLLRQKSLGDLPSTVIESIARIDGGIVMDRDFRLLAFGAILRLGSPIETPEGIAEGGRTTAAIGASHFGNVLKVSEDGLVAFYRNGACIWEM
jgi:hypothetical protein